MNDNSLEYVAKRENLTLQKCDPNGKYCFQPIVFSKQENDDILVDFTEM